MYLQTETSNSFLMKFVVKDLKMFPNKMSKIGTPNYLLSCKDRPIIFKIMKNFELFFVALRSTSLFVSKMEDMQEEIRNRSSFSAVVR
jgi:hypothetical protein